MRKLYTLIVSTRISATLIIPAVAEAGLRHW